MDLTPQIRSVHYKDEKLGTSGETRKSNLSVITSLHNADAVAYRHDSSILELPFISASQRGNLANFNLLELDIKARRGQSLFALASMEDIETLVNINELANLARSVDQWLTPLNQALSFIETIDQQRLCRARNLVAELAVAGDKHTITNDPPFLTRPSHVLRISENPLRIDDSWKISTRIRHIARSLYPQIMTDIRQRYVSSTKCKLDVMDPVVQVLSRWRSWELSSIQDSFFFKWLSGRTENNAPPIPSEGILLLQKAKGFIEMNDGLQNTVCFEGSSFIYRGLPKDDLNVIAISGISNRISVQIETDILDILQLINRRENYANIPSTVVVDAQRETPRPRPTIEYDGSFSSRVLNVSAHLATVPIDLGVQYLKLSGISQTSENSQSFRSLCLSFEEATLGVLAKTKSRDKTIQITLAHLSSQLVSRGDSPGIAANLSAIDIRFLRPIPTIIRQAGELFDRIGKAFSISVPDTPRPSSAFQRPILAVITLRLHRINVESWLLPDALLVTLESDGMQAVLGNLTPDQQWCFLDVQPLTLSIRQPGLANRRLGELVTPFITIKTRVQWNEGFCSLNSDMQVGKFTLSLANVTSLLRAIGSEEVVAHLIECREAIELARLRSTDVVESPAAQKGSSLLISYRAHAIWDAIEITADTPEGRIVLACTDIRASITNTIVEMGTQRVLFTLRSENTSLSIDSVEEPDYQSRIVDLQWEVGNSITFRDDGLKPFRIYFVSNALTVAMSPKSINQASQITQNIVQEVEKLKIGETIANLKALTTPGSSSPKRQPAQDQDPFQPYSSIDGVLVSFLDCKFQWFAEDPRNRSQGFTLRCKNVDASVVDRITRARFVMHGAELELDSHVVAASSNYAKLPKLDVNVFRQIDADGWQLQLDAHGDAVEVNFTPLCVEVSHAVLESIRTAATSLRTHFPHGRNKAVEKASTSHPLPEQTKKLKAVVASIEFSGARINAQYDNGFKPSAYMSRYQVEGDGCDVGNLHIPGLSLQSRFSRIPQNVLHAEIRILESSNLLAPSIKPFLHDTLRRIEEVMSRRKTSTVETPGQPVLDPGAITASILGDLKLNVGLRMQPQALTLTCDPFTKIDAKVGLDEVYATLISCISSDRSQWFAVMMTVSGAHVLLQHQYSGIASAKVRLKDLSLSMFNNARISSTEPGISAIIKSSGLDVFLNVRQGLSSHLIIFNSPGQDFLIFNSIWLEGPPPDPFTDLQSRRVSNPITMMQLQKAGASPPSFPINITVHLKRIKCSLDLGQSIGTTDVEILGLRMSNRKCSERHHYVFISMDSVQAESKGRFSGYMKGRNLTAQTSIYSPTIAVAATPIVQIDVKFGYVEFRASFEYHVFLIGDTAGLRFTIYNRRIRSEDNKSSDRLVFLGDSQLIQFYATAEGPALVLSLYKSVIQLQGEKERNRTEELASFLASNLAVRSPRPRPSQEILSLWHNKSSRVDMEMSIKFVKINIGIFKGALNDSPVFRVNVANIRAWFSQIVTRGALENQLILSLGNLIIALSPLKRMSGKELAEMEVERWVKHVSTMKGGVILAVPETEGSMWTKQEQESDTVQHVFKSRLDGKVDVGWNYGSVMYVQDLWKTFELNLERGAGSRATALPTTEDQPSAETSEAATERRADVVEPGTKDGKPTAISSREFRYVALEPAIIETPQLRQMGEATPPVEWIGVNRMKLPAFTHQVVIVPLQKVSRRVENLYNLTLQSGGA